MLVCMAALSMWVKLSSWPYRRMWDFGVYVSIPSVDPLRAYVYDNIVLRFCKDPYQLDLEKAVSDGYCSKAH